MVVNKEDGADERETFRKLFDRQTNSKPDKQSVQAEWKM